MTFDRCKSCGGELERIGNYYVCKFCGSKWMIDADNDVHVIDRANAWSALRDCDFERAVELFENIIFKEPKNHEAYWGRALANAGIMYVNDFYEHKKVATCNSISETSFLQSSDVVRAIELAPADIAESYKEQAGKIEDIRVEWVKKASLEPAYDIFISYKDSDREHDIDRTDDSYDAHELYMALTEAGYKVFFSRVSLRNKVSEHYEPYIYNAIKTAKVMIVFGEKPEYFNAVWIKNEWMRFRKRIELREKHPNSLVVAYKGLNPADLPIGLRTRQCLDAGSMTFLDDLKKHIERVMRIDEPVRVVMPSATRANVKAPAKPKSKKGIIIAAIALILAVAIGVGFVVSDLVKVERETEPVTDVPLVTEKETTASEAVETEGKTEGQTPSETEAVEAPSETDTETDIGTENGTENGTETATETETETETVFTDELGLEYSLNEDGSYTLESVGSCTAKNIVIPKQYKGAAVTRIADNAFCVRDDILSVTISDGVQSIGGSAFYGCTGLTSIEIPDSVESIGDGAFWNCRNITEFTIGRGVRYIGEHAFERCDSLTTVNYMGSQADWEKIDIPENGNGDLLSLKVNCLGDTDETFELSVPVAGYIGKGHSTDLHVYNETTNDYRVHLGIDIISEENAPVYAAADGVISLVWNDSAMGMCIEILHEGGISTYYKNLDNVLPEGIEKGVSVQCGQLIGTVGNTAPLEKKDKPHLHFEVMKNGIQVDPKDCFSSEALDMLEPHVCEFGGWVTVIEAKCTEGGKQERACTCGETETRQIDALGHDEVEHEAQTPSCTEIGWSAYVTCSRCDYSTYSELDASHDYNAENTCTVCEDYLDKGVEFTLSGDEYSITDYTGNEKKVIVPSTYKGKPVTKIEKDAFYNRSITNITIPGSVISIGESAFAECTSLETVVMLDGITQIGATAFTKCTSLKNISIPDTITQIGYMAFNECTSLQYSVYDNAYYLGNDSNKFIVLVQATEQGISSCDIHPFTKIIYSKAFYNCRSLDDVNIPPSVTNIGKDAFQSSASLRNVYISDIAAYCSITHDGRTGLLVNAALCLDGEVVRDLVIPEGVTEIGDRAFCDYKLLESVTILNGVTHIGDSAFAQCTSLESITISDSVTSIGSNAFGKCSSLKRVNISDIEAWCNISFGDSYSNPTSNSYGLYLNDEPIYDLIIPEGITSIKDYAFFHCSQFVSVKMPDSVTSIGDSAFMFCTNISGLTMPKNVTSIGMRAFRTCTGLGGIRIPNSVTSIGAEAFLGCNNMTEVVFENRNGWRCVSEAGATGGTSISLNDLMDVETAETYLTSTYVYRYWYRD